MKVAYLGPFENSALRQFLPDLSDADLGLAPGMGGYGLVPVVVERIRRKLPTVLITLDDHLPEGRILHREGESFSFFALPRRKRKAIRDRFNKEVSLIQEALSRVKPDLIHAHWTYEYAWAALRIPHGRPVLITARDHCGDVLKWSGPRYLPLFLLSRWVLRRAKYLTVVSPHIYVLADRLSRAKIWLVPNPVLPKGFCPAPSPGGRDSGAHILWAGNDSRLKNPRNAILAFRRIRGSRPDTILDLCGPGLHPGGQIHSWAKRRRVEAGIVFHGRVSGGEFAGLLATAEVFLHTSRTEACNNAVAEALCSGVPVVGGKAAGGIPWQLDYGEAGILVDVENPDAIAAAVLRALSDGCVRAILSKKGQSYGRELHDIRTIMAQYDSIYLEIQANEKTLVR